MLLLIGGQKGGSGKTTLATNIAVYLAGIGQDVLLVDMDPQGTATNWADERAEHPDLPQVSCVSKSGNVKQVLLDLKSRYSQIVVDCAGRDNVALRSATLAADKMYTPIKASQADLWTIEHMDEVVQEAKVYNEQLEAHIVIQMAPTNPQVNEAQEARQMLADFPTFKLSDVIVRERKVYRDALGVGRGVLETENLKAAAEIRALSEEIYGNTGIGINTAKESGHALSAIG